MDAAGRGRDTFNSLAGISYAATVYVGAENATFNSLAGISEAREPRAPRPEGLSIPLRVFPAPRSPIPESVIWPFNSLAGISYTFITYYTVLHVQLSIPLRVFRSGARAGGGGTKVALSIPLRVFLLRSTITVVELGDFQFPCGYFTW